MKMSKSFRLLRSICLAASMSWGVLAALPAVAADAQVAQTHYLFVFSSPVAGKEAEFNKWYDEQHGPDVTSVPGFVSGQRYELAPLQMRGGSPALPKYLIVYKIVAPDLAKVYAEVNRRAQSGETRMSNSVDVKSFVNRTYRTIRPELVGTAPAGKAAAGTKDVYNQFVFGEAKTGLDTEFNDWYDKHHAPDILAVPGYVGGQRMVYSDVQLNNAASGSTYLMVFRIETADLAATFSEFGALAPKMTMTPAFDGDRTFGYTYKAIGPLLDGDRIRAGRANK